MKPSGLAHWMWKGFNQEAADYFTWFWEIILSDYWTFIGLVILFFEKLDNAKLSSQLLS